jgi:hypothetical protein
MIYVEILVVEFLVRWPGERPLPIQTKKEQPTRLGELLFWARG